MGVIIVSNFAISPSYSRGGGESDGVRGEAIPSLPTATVGSDGEWP